MFVPLSASQTESDGSCPHLLLGSYSSPSYIIANYYAQCLLLGADLSLVSDALLVEHSATFLWTWKQVHL